MLKDTRTRYLRFLVTLILAGAASLAPARPIAFENVNVVGMDSERVHGGQTVLIDGQRIAAVGPGDELAVPADARRIDGTGHYLMPGLYELHAHVPTTPAPTERVLALFLANGVTTIRGMLGAPGHLELREQLASGERLGPRLITSGPSLNGQSVDGAARAREMVRSQHAAGYDFIKLHPGLTRAEFDAVVDAAARTGMPFAGHVSEEVGIGHALSSGQDSIDHLDGYMQALIGEDTSLALRQVGFFGLGLASLVDEKKIVPMARRTARAGVWNVPTQTLIENFWSDVPGSVLAAREAMRYMPPETVTAWVRRKDAFLADATYVAADARRAIAVRRILIKALHEEGAGLLLGSDAPQVFNVPGFATHDELALLVASGLTPFEALQTGTVNPARYFNEQDTRGRVAAGNIADLVLVSANPLKDIHNARKIAGVMAGGRWLSRDDLDAMLQQFDERR